MRRLKLTKTGKQDFRVRENEALKESIRRLELEKHEQWIELTKARRELDAARLLLAIHRVQGDARLNTTAERDHEMGEFVRTIVQDREVEVVSYEEGRARWLEQINA